MTLFWVALGLSIVLTGLVIPLLRRAQFLDLPNHRSSHEVPTPRGGGLAVMLAVALGPLVVGRLAGWSVFLPACLLAMIGLGDDIWSLSSRVRLAAQIGVGALVGVVVATDEGLGGQRGAVFVAVCLLGVVSYVNAFNFMDGVNGISALNGALAGLWFAWLGHDNCLPVLATLGAVIAGGSLGFLPWNAASRVFLGDVGSYGLGALIAGSASLAWAAGVPGALAIAPLLVYLADTAWVILRRARARKPVMEAHREHVYQRLVQLGWPHLGSAVWTAGVSGAVALAMAWLYPTRPGLALVSTAVLVGIYLASPRVLGALNRDGVVPT